MSHGCGGQTGKSLVPNDICNDHKQALVSQTMLNSFLLTQDLKHLAFTLSSLLVAQALAHPWTVNVCEADTESGQVLGGQCRDI